MSQIKSEIASQIESETVTSVKLLVPITEITLDTLRVNWRDIDEEVEFLCKL